MIEKKREKTELELQKKKISTKFNEYTFQIPYRKKISIYSNFREAILTLSFLDRKLSPQHPDLSKSE